MKSLVYLTTLTFVALFSGCATKPSSSDCHGAQTHSWEAWNNLMPGAGKTIHVIGKVRVNSGGWTATLSKRVPQGINPEILLLDLKVTPPTGPVTAPVLDLPVEFSEKYTGEKFTKTQVFCGEKVIADLPVKDTH